MIAGKKAGIVSTGRALPVVRLTNFDLEHMVETSDEWITTRSGIKERRIISGDETNSGLSEIAARIALEKAGLKPEEIDILIVATVTADQLLPSSACLVQAKLNAHRAAAFDLAAGCTGFLYGLTVGQQFIETGAAKNILLIGVDTLSPIVDWTDRNTCVLFGDGAGAVVLQRVEEGRGILASKMYSDGTKAELLDIPAGGSKRPTTVRTLEERAHYIRMNGPEIFKFAVKIMVESTTNVLELCGKKPADLDFIVPHQANVRIINAACKRLGLSDSQVLVNIQRYGNMSSATIPVVLDEALEEGKIKQGDLLTLVSFGAGLTWGAAVLNW
ncbi:MAG TPA: ketoacyl-ACP synthase III [Firmicutes bacterium]|jgi:3-oxoacyl-[acyl-carrier-protein] synthase-3|nr:ketoacyl-ACP synthase III [Bacillota bacterium]